MVPVIWRMVLAACFMLVGFVGLPMSAVAMPKDDKKPAKPAVDKKDEKKEAKKPKVYSASKIKEAQQKCLKVMLEEINSRKPGKKLWKAYKLYQSWRVVELRQLKEPTKLQERLRVRLKLASKSKGKSWWSQQAMVWETDADILKAQQQLAKEKKRKFPEAQEKELLWLQWLLKKSGKKQLTWPALQKGLSAIWKCRSVQLQSRRLPSKPPQRRRLPAPRG